VFTGIIEQKGSVESLSKNGDDFKLFVRSELFDPGKLNIGASVSVSGVCLTVCAINNQVAEFDISSETARATTLGTLEAKKNVNLELPLKVGHNIDGHFVLGHVDEVVSLLKNVTEENTIKFIFSLPSKVSDLLAPKGSVTLDGVSLTIGEVTKSDFSVYLIPHSLALTTFENLSLGDKVNLEADCIARYLKNLSKNYLAGFK
jgi:riboflavin synthase